MQNHFRQKVEGERSFHYYRMDLLNSRIQYLYIIPDPFF